MFLALSFFSLKDLLIFPLCFIILFLILRNRANSYKDPNIRQIYYRAFYFKLIGVFAFTILLSFILKEEIRHYTTRVHKTSGRLLLLIPIIFGWHYFLKNLPIKALFSIFFITMDMRMISLIIICSMQPIFFLPSWR